ncbi:MAG TPA: M56 family metallopeptidase [Vicinamibacteria bacterium]|nr:M56 family metallopeptidase [Vicinamibacteria bacterium]
MPLLARLLLTYLIHSTLLLAAAALACRLLRERRLVLQEALLRAALLGGVVASVLQVGLELRPVAGVLHVPLAGRPAVAAPPGPAPPLAAAPGETAVESGGSALDGAGASAPWQARVVLAPTVFERLGSRAVESWRTLLAVAWAALAALGLLRLAVAGLRLHRLLRGRRPIVDGPLAPEAASVATALGLRGPVPLSSAPRLVVPLATGVLRPQACLPARAVAELGTDELIALCAHELAHVRRRDPAWLMLARLLEALLPLQPLNTWARGRLQELAECLSDDLAVCATARPLGLARSLVDVASWTVDGRRVLPAAAAGALSARSRLGHRVERLMDPFRALERPRRLLLPVAALAVAATALLAPAVSGSGGDDPAAPVAAIAPAAAAAPVAALAEAAPPPPPPAAAAAAAPVAPAPPAGADGTDDASAASRQQLEQRMEELGRRIEQRAQAHEAEMRKLDAEMQALASRFQPNQAEMERLGREMEKAAAELSASIAADFAQGVKAGGDERTKAASRRLAELGQQMHAIEKQLDTEQMHALGEKARELAEQARPNEKETRELEQLSHELARVGQQATAEATAQARQAMEEARAAMEQAREAMREAAEAMRHAGPAEPEPEPPKQRQ